MIAVLLTPPGAAAIAVVRICGQEVLPFLHAHFAATPHAGRAVHGDLRYGDRVIDDPVVVLVDETTADINLHGGPWGVRATLELLSRNGFATVRQTPASPLPPHAVDAIGGDCADPLIWQEVLADLPRARTELAVRMLLAQPAAWRALLDAPPDAAAIADMLTDRTMKRMLSTAGVAIVGPANVGKSTLANRLFGRDRSITADLPGTTRDWVGELANLGGIAVMLVDTPGLRPSDDRIEQAAIASARTQIAAADVVVVVLDATRPIGEQRSVISEHPRAIIAINKSDAVTDATPLHTPLGIQVSARTGAGSDELIGAILRNLGCGDRSMEAARCWTARQRDILIQLQG